MKTVTPKTFTVVVADRAQAQVYETARIGGALVRVATLENPNAHLHERDLGAAAPGRSLNRNSGVHQAFASKHSLREQVTASFARVVARNLAQSVRAAQGNGIVLVAGQRMLFELRRALPRNVQNKVIREIRKDLVHQPKRDLLTHLRAA